MSSTARSHNGRSRCLTAFLRVTRCPGFGDNSALATNLLICSASPSICIYWGLFRSTVPIHSNVAQRRKWSLHSGNWGLLSWRERTTTRITCSMSTSLDMLNVFKRKLLIADRMGRPSNKSYPDGKSAAQLWLGRCQPPVAVRDIQGLRSVLWKMPYPK